MNNWGNKLKIRDELECIRSSWLHKKGEVYLITKIDGKFIYIGGTIIFTQVPYIYQHYKPYKGFKK